MMEVGQASQKLHTTIGANALFSASADQVRAAFAGQRAEAAVLIAALEEGIPAHAKARSVLSAALRGNHRIDVEGAHA